MAFRSVTGTLGHRLLAELIRVREEAAGHPVNAPNADAAGRAAGGGMARRVRARAAALPDASDLRATLRRQARLGSGLAGGLVAVFALAGLLAAPTALGSGSAPISLPLALAALVGINLATLLLWLVLLPFSRRAAPGLGGMIRAIWRRTGLRRIDSGASVDSEAIGLLLGGAAGRWLLATAAHLAWVAFTLAALLSLTLLLSARAYELTWQTTLLSPDGLQAWATFLSWGPALLGVPGPGELPMTGAMPTPAREAWAFWLLAAVSVYGLGPRVLALAFCAGAAWYHLARLGTDMRRPGYARLRARLMPDHGNGPTAARPATRETATGHTTPSNPLPAPPLHALALEYEPRVAPEGDGLIWLGHADDADSRERIREQLARTSVDALAVLVRAAATPDRGSERYLATLQEAAGAPPAVLVLCGPGNAQEAEWRALAHRAGFSNGVAPWPGDADLLQALGGGTA